MSSSIPTSGKKYRTSEYQESEKIEDVLHSKTVESNETVRNLLKTFEHHESYEG